MATLDELAENTEITDTDLVHTRDGSGLDHKVSGDNLRKTVGAQTSTLSSNTTINLSNYKSGLVVIADTGSIELTFTNTLNDGYTLIIISQADDVDIIIEGVTTTINENDVFKYVSDTANMLPLTTQNPTVKNITIEESAIIEGNLYSENLIDSGIKYVMTTFTTTEDTVYTDLEGYFPRNTITDVDQAVYRNLRFGSISGTYPDTNSFNRLKLNYVNGGNNTIDFQSISLDGSTGLEAITTRKSITQNDSSAIYKYLIILF